MDRDDTIPISATPINWFPGHMAVTRRLMKENLGAVDLVLELVDARIPKSSQNPEIDALLQSKKRIVILNKSDLADPDQTARWKDFLMKKGLTVLELDSKTGKNKSVQTIALTAKHLLHEKLEKERAKGMRLPIRAMVVGIPNVGKSTLINTLAGAKKARAENRPGVTKTKQWVRAGEGLELLDMPGVLWPKFEDPTVGENLAITGAIKDSILDSVHLAHLLLSRLVRLYPSLLLARYRLPEEALSLSLPDLFFAIGKKRGFLVSGGDIDEERCAMVLLDEFRAGIIGRMTLEAPEE